MMTDPVGTWHYDDFTAFDGRTFCIHSEQARGEDRFYWAKERVADGTGDRVYGQPGEDNWRRLPDAAGFDKRTVKRRVERYVRETNEKRRR